MEPGVGAMPRSPGDTLPPVPGPEVGESSPESASLPATEGPRPRGDEQQPGSPWAPALPSASSGTRAAPSEEQVWCVLETRPLHRPWEGRAGRGLSWPPSPGPAPAEPGPLPHQPCARGSARIWTGPSARLTLALPRSF